MGWVIGQGRKSTVFGRHRVFIDAWLSRVHCVCAAAVSKNQSAENVGNYTISQCVPLQEFLIYVEPQPPIQCICVCC